MPPTVPFAPLPNPQLPQGSFQRSDDLRRASSNTFELIRTDTMLSNAWGRGVAILSVLAALGVGLVLGRLGRSHDAAVTPEQVADRVTTANPGPWGRLEYVPISIECPGELLPMRAFETAVTHWIFKGYTIENFLRLLDDAGIAGPLREELRSPAVLHVVEGGLDVTPTPNIVLNLPPAARKQIYTVLAGFPENGSSLYFLQIKTMDERFAGSGVSAATVELLRKVSCEYGRYLVFSDVPSIFSQIPTYEERVGFLKALTRQSTMIVKLHVTADSDLDALVNYWGKACWAKDARPLLESLSRIPGGARLDVSHLLPPSPSALLYSFPLPANPMDGPTVRKDCHYTAFNFFRDPPDARYAKQEFIVERLKEDHFPVLSDPRYGDLVLFLTPAGSLIHSAVYLADNIVYTKNGDTSLHPWMLSTVQDLIDQYSFQVAPDKALDVKYFRNKYY
jgi:hypothetical protein